MTNGRPLKWSVLLYSPYGRRPDYYRDYPPQYYPPPNYYYPYPNVNPYEAAYQSHEADKLARWIWMLIIVVVLIAVAGVVAFIVFLSSISASDVIVPLGCLPAMPFSRGRPPNF